MNPIVGCLEVVAAASSLLLAGENTFPQADPSSEADFQRKAWLCVSVNSCLAYEKGSEVPPAFSELPHPPIKTRLQ